jgi:2-amino-4-hydroxy-6-hydroxymethyldihydropteridine diphosphokinase
MNRSEHEVCLLLGSNIQPETNLPRAVALIQKRLKVLQVSSVWESKAVGFDGPDFLNAAVLVLTSLSATTLKEQILLPLEAQMGRVRSGEKNAPRRIDLDIIVFDGRLLDPDLWRYSYRAVPVAEILPGCLSNSGEELAQAAERLMRAAPLHLRPDVSIMK